MIAIRKLINFQFDFGFKMFNELKRYGSKKFNAVSSVM